MIHMCGYCKLKHKEKEEAKECCKEMKEQLKGIKETIEIREGGNEDGR